VKFLKVYTHFFEKYFPSPLAIALLLSFFTFFFCLVIFNFEGNIFAKSAKIGLFWFEGIWNENLLAFTIHMMLILVLGHILALSKAANIIINFGLKFSKNTASAAFTISLFTVLISLFNWGLGLVFGAVFSRKIGEYFTQQGKPINYPLIGAAAYSGMMVWHGGLSGSATLTLAGASHSLFDKVGAISLADTTFSWLNVFVTVLLILILPISLYFLGKKVGSQPVLNLKTNVKDEDDLAQNQWLDKSNFLGVFTGASILLYWCFLNFQKVNEGVSVLSIINLQTTNILLLGLCFLMHGSLANFTKALEKAIGGASSILIQFPLYFGILGMVQQSGLNVLLSNLLSSASSELYLSIYTFFSAGLLNVFVPSGGGQWQLQGVIIVEAAQKINADLPKLIMAFCYGDQLTNMLQPFWALPLLGITGLKAREILPYSLLIFVIGLLVFLLGLIIF
jgi:short-chain fatty acids transporter